MTKRTFLRPSDHRGWVLLCFAFYLLSQLIRGTTPTQEVLNSIPSTSSSIHFNTQISFPVAPCARYPIWKKFPPAFRTNGTYLETWIFFVKVQLNNCCLLLKRFDLIFYDLNDSLNCCYHLLKTIFEKECMWKQGERLAKLNPFINLLSQGVWISAQFKNRSLFC